jgi:hypothetical protein
VKFGACQNPGCMFRHITDKRRKVNTTHSEHESKRDSSWFKIKNDDERFNRLATLQTHKGFWEMNEEVVSVLGVSIFPWKPSELGEDTNLSNKMWSTILCVGWLTEYLGNLRENSYGDEMTEVCKDCIALAKKWMNSKQKNFGKIDYSSLIQTANRLRKKVLQKSSSSSSSLPVSSRSSSSSSNTQKW